MGRGNFLAKAELSDQWYLDYDLFKTDGEFDFEYDQTKVDFTHEVIARFPSFTRTDKWIERDCEAMLENELFYIGMADNEWSLCITLQSKDDGCHLSLARSHFQSYDDGIQKILLDLFGEIYKRGSAWTSCRITA